MKTKIREDIGSLERLAPVALFYLVRCPTCQYQREMIITIADDDGQPVVACGYCGSIDWSLTTRFLRDH